MMIWLIRGGGGAVLFVVSVLCGAGGGLTVHAEVAWVSTSVVARARAPAVTRLRRAGLGTDIRVSGRR
ncbi:hypothetical protein MHIB_06780 [Mycolicibacter hiberniae]|uniref:Uncharacterized protein n=1 Tax=Mycolicibacter hiberniae TaxID=29314 RepID=A0A7I7WYN0_9MYCO|nr:hypothetical protein MHIB_06780 [Mycolicibacter hiberniae]